MPAMLDEPPQKTRDAKGRLVKGARINPTAKPKPLNMAQAVKEALSAADKDHGTVGKALINAAVARARAGSFNHWKDLADRNDGLNVQSSGSSHGPVTIQILYAPQQQPPALQSNDSLTPDEQRLLP